MAKHNERTLIEFQEEQEKVSEKYTFFNQKLPKSGKTHIFIKKTLKTVKITQYSITYTKL